VALTALVSMVMPFNIVVLTSSSNRSCFAICNSSSIMYELVLSG
jgi:hypothetical protein